MTDNVARIDMVASCGNCYHNHQEWIEMDMELDSDNEQIVATCPRCGTSVYLSYTASTEEVR